MAFNVSYIFQARDQYSAVAKKIKKQTQGLTKQFQGFRSQLFKTNNAFKQTSNSMGSGFRRLAAAALGFFGAREFLRTGAQFQTSMADLSAITGAVGDDFDMLKSKTLAMAKVSKLAQSEVAESIKLVASAKPELLKNLPLLLETTEQILLLSNASGVDLATAALFGTKSLNIFGKSAEDTAKFVNILAAGSKFGSSEIFQTGEAVIIAGGNARSAGLNFLQLNAAIQVAARGGFVASQAGTALNAIFGRLRRLGLDIGKLGLEKTFSLVKKALDAETDSTKKALLETKLFGEEHAKVGLALVNNVKLFGQFERELAGTNVAQEQAGVRLATFAAKMRGLGVVVKDKLIRVFEKLSPTFEKITMDAAAFIDAITPQQIEAFAGGLKNFTLASVEIVKTLSSELIPTVKEFMGIMDTASVGAMVNNLTSIASAVNLILAPVKLLASLLKGVGIAIGEGAAQLSTFNFDAKNATSFADAFSIGGKLFGLFDREKSAAAKLSPEITSPSAIGTVLPGAIPIRGVPEAPAMTQNALQSQSKADITVNIRAPEGVVQSIKTVRKGDTQAMNLGVNMQSAG